MMMTANATGTNGLTGNMEELKIINFGHPSYV
jgi:hypothetical protein